MIAINSHGQEFEVTEADQVVVAPLGMDSSISEETQRERLVECVKHMVKWAMPDYALPVGYWDCWLDEGEWADPDENGGEMVCIRGYDSAKDDPFIRLQTAGTDSMWDLEVFTRRTRDDGSGDFQAQPAIQGEDYTPEDCVRDLGALLSVFRLFVQQGRL